MVAADVKSAGPGIIIKKQKDRLQAVFLAQSQSLSGYAAWLMTGGLLRIQDPAGCPLLRAMRSSIVYRPGDLSFRKRTAASAPTANTLRE